MNLLSQIKTMAADDDSKDFLCPLGFAVATLMAVCIASVIFIPVTTLVTTETTPDCNYYTKNGCTGSCGCNWCDTINICTDDVDRCSGLNITSAEECAPNYIGLYVVVSIIGCMLMISIVCWSITACMCYESRRYIVVGGSVPATRSATSAAPSPLPEEIEMKVIDLEK